MVKIMISLVFLLWLASCSSTPKPGEPDYVREQVYQCRVLCAGGEVSITKIQGLDCVCNKPEKQTLLFAPIINNNIAGGGGAASSPAQTSQPPVYVVSPQASNLTPNNNAASVTDASGRVIFSQTKE